MQSQSQFLAKVAKHTSQIGWLHLPLLRCLPSVRAFSLTDQIFVQCMFQPPLKTHYLFFQRIWRVIYQHENIIASYFNCASRRASRSEETRAWEFGPHAFLSIRSATAAAAGQTDGRRVETISSCPRARSRPTLTHRPATPIRLISVNAFRATCLQRKRWVLTPEDFAYVFYEHMDSPKFPIHDRISRREKKLSHISL